MFRGYEKRLCLTIGLALMWPALLPGQQPENPVEAIEDMFKTLGEQAGPFAPMFGKMSPEQLKRLEGVRISVAEEGKFGTKVLDAYLEQLRHAKTATTRAGKDVDYLRQLCASLQPSMKNSKRYQRIDLLIVETDSADAYSIPGGHLLLTRGLLDNCGSEAALMGTLAHELSHLDRGHQLLQLKHAKLSRQPLNFDDSMMWISLVARPFRPEQESEADADATEWMMAAGYEPAELARLLNSWEQQQARQTPWLKFLPTMIKSHPSPGRRAEEILQRSAQLKRQYPLAKYVGAENLKRRIPKSERTFP